MYPLKSGKKMVPETFRVPTRVDLDGLILAPVSIDNWYVDYDAIQATVETLGLNPGIDWEFPLGEVEFGLIDACAIIRNWQLGASFTYGVLTPDESFQLGCLYVSGSRKRGYDADIFCWVRDSELEKGLRDKVYQFAEQWIRDVWPLKKVTWPGRKIPWEEWYALPDKDPQNWPGNLPTYCLQPRRLVPDSFAVPSHVETERFILVPLEFSMDSISKRHAAYMSSWDYLKTSFPEIDWPASTAFDDAVVDVGALKFQWYLRSIFVYSIRDRNDTRELGCIFVAPTRKKAFQAEVHTWVRESELASGLDEEVNEFSHRWIRKEWPFEQVAWPGRDIPSEEWVELSQWESDPK